MYKTKFRKKLKNGFAIAFTALNITIKCQPKAKFLQFFQKKNSKSDPKVEFRPSNYKIISQPKFSYLYPLAASPLSKTFAPQWL